jgi:hypothetical protein
MFTAVRLWTEVRKRENLCCDCPVSVAQPCCSRRAPIETFQHSSAPLPIHFTSERKCLADRLPRVIGRSSWLKCVAHSLNPD